MTVLTRRHRKSLCIDGDAPELRTDVRKGASKIRYQVDIVIRRNGGLQDTLHIVAPAGPIYSQ